MQLGCNWAATGGPGDPGGPGGSCCQSGLGGLGGPAGLGEPGGPCDIGGKICRGTATSNACFWVWVHILVNLVAMAFLFTMNLCLPWVLNFNLSQARLLKETACNYVFSVLVHGIPSISAWISIHQNSQKLFCAKTSIGH